jgi:colanic acid/amylovoran biosynthesis glycosyltransferase
MTIRRVAYVVNVFPKLSETFIANELVELQRRGIELCIISLRKPAEALQHHFIRASGLLEQTSYDSSDFSAVLNEFRPQVMHAHFATEPAAAARNFSQELRVPFTFTAHGYDIFRKPPPDFQTRASAASAVVTVSRANGDYIHKHYGVAKDHLRIIPCGVNTELFKPLSRKREGPPLILCVARHVPVKNLPLLLRACAILRDQNVLFQCVILGDGKCQDELEALRSDLGLQELVAMPGAAEQQEVLVWLQSAAIAVLTSENEGLPVCLMEAGACGLPVVATAVGGVPELIQDGITGILTKPGDAGDLADALQRLLKDSELRTKLGNAGRHRVEEFFSLREQANQLIELWKQILRRNGHSL